MVARELAAYRVFTAYTVMPTCTHASAHSCSRVFSSPHPPGEEISHLEEGGGGGRREGEGCRETALGRMTNVQHSPPQVSGTSGATPTSSGLGLNHFNRAT